MDHHTKIAQPGQPRSIITCQQLHVHDWQRAIFVGVLGLAMLLLAYWLTPATLAAHAQSTVPPGAVYLPWIANGEIPVAERIGFGLTSPSLSQYPAVEQLGAGWYLDWQVRAAPERPGNIQYAQMIRVHQKLSCGQWFHRDRNACPYATPLDYVYMPEQATIEAAAQANPGSLWLIGNEMDRIDWGECANIGCTQIFHNGQDETLPETYAVAYHDLYHLIKAVDPTARLAIGGMIQPTPLRLTYLTKVWDSYQATYSTTMPVDVWNVHNFIIQEKAKDWGADIPPGVDAQVGAYVDHPETHIDLTIFDQQIRAFRQWMKERGQQDKPLVVSEYGILYYNDTMELCKGSQEQIQRCKNDPSYVQEFMIDTFDYFYQTRDCDLGLTSDGCRLVQQWNWYSLDDTWGNFNPYSRLFDPDTKQMTATGERFRQYIAASR